MSEHSIREKRCQGANGDAASFAASFPVRFTIRGIIVAVALVAANVSAVIATSWYYPRQPLPSGSGAGFSNGITDVFWSFDGSVVHSRAVVSRDGATTYRCEYIEWPLPRPTLLRIWAPVVGSAALTILALTALWCPRRRRIPRAIVIAAGFTSLNIAATAVVLEPFPETDEVIRSRRIPNTLMLSRRAPAIIYRRDDTGGLREQLIESPWHSGGVQHIVPRPDGSVIEYWEIGKAISQPRVLKPPGLSWLSIWWPLMASTSITLLVLIVAVRPRLLLPRGPRFRVDLTDGLEVGLCEVSHSDQEPHRPTAAP